MYSKCWICQKIPELRKFVAVVVKSKKGRNRFVVKQQYEDLRGGPAVAEEAAPPRSSTVSRSRELLLNGKRKGKRKIKVRAAL